MKTLHTVLAVVGVAAVSGAAWWFQNKPTALQTRVEGAMGAGASSAGRPAAGGAGPGGPAAVEVGKVAALRIEQDAQAVGTVRSRQGVMLRPEVSGRISRIGFADGERVRRSQLLFQLDNALQLAQLKQAEAQASIARSNLQRNRELVAENFVSQSVLDQSAAALQVAEAQVALAQAQLARMRIEAPFDGAAGIRTVNIGDYVKDGADLVSIEDNASVFVDFRLPERSLSLLKRGQPVAVQLDAYPGREFKGQIDAIDALLDTNGRSLLARARLPNAGGELRSGMFARARVLFAVRESALVVPEEALVPQGAKQFLFKIVDGPSGKVSQKIEARIGARVPGKVEILAGVSAGDLVVTAGQARLMRGDAVPVRVVDVARAGERPGAAARGPGGAPPASAAASGVSPLPARSASAP